MFCKKCGSDIPDEASVCKYCDAETDFVPLKNSAKSSNNSSGNQHYAPTLKWATVNESSVIFVSSGSSLG